ncbi:MAG: uroporphyrinogen decarboxylase family protein [Terriglobia bacterium]
MNTVERFQAVFQGKPVDRVPVCAWLGLPLLKTLMGKTTLELLHTMVSDPLQIVHVQEQLGLDPILVAVDDRWFSMHRFWRLLYSWPQEALENWQVSQEVIERGNGFAVYRFVVSTPHGPIRWSYRVGDSQVSPLERPIQEERDLDLLIQSMPDPEWLNQDKLCRIVRQVADRAFHTFNFMGVWGEAVNMRGLERLITDMYESPSFVERLSEFLAERAIRRIKHLAKTGIHSIIYDQSWVGVGFSAETFRKFMLPYDRKVVSAAREAGLLVSYHNCGRGIQFLEEMLSTGAEALETLTPKENSGDFDLSEVKRRVGNHVTLNGGFNERLLASGQANEVRDEVTRCLDAAGSGGRYILRTCGQIMKAAPNNIEIFAETARERGRY